MAIKHRTLDSFVVDELRERIVSGTLQGGTRIDQQALAEELGVSRMPVREALRRLSAEGFVELISHRGAVVAKLSPEEIVEVYEMRAVLHGLASRLAVPNYTDEDIEAIKQLLETMDATKDPGEWIELNKAFHERIELPSGATHLQQLIERLSQQCAPYVQISLRYLHAEKPAEQQHHAIYDACVARDPEALEQLVRGHLSSWGQEVAGYVERAASDGADEAAAS